MKKFYFTFFFFVILNFGMIFSQNFNIVNILYHNNYVYTISQYGLYKFSMNGTKLNLLGCNTQITYTKGRLSISSNGNFLYIADDSLIVYNVTSNDPSIVKTIDVEGLATDVKTRGNYIIIASPLLEGKDGFGNSTFGGINIYDISSPDIPTLQSQGKSTITDKCDHIEKIDIFNNMVYGFTSVKYGCGNPRLFVWNISNINSPQNIGVENGNLTGSELIEIKNKDDNWAFVLQADGDINRYNIRNKSAPFWINKISQTRNSPPSAMCIIGDISFVTHSDGIDEFDLSDTSKITRFQDQKFVSYGIGFSTMEYTGNYFIVASPIYLYTFDTNLNKLDSTKLAECPVDVNEDDVYNTIFSIIPNPAKENIKIAYYKERIGKTKIKLFNAFGQNIYCMEASNESFEFNINTEFYPTGVYWVQLTFIDNNGSILVQNKEIVIIK